MMNHLPLQWNLNLKTPTPPKEVYSLYVTEKPRLTQNSQALSKPKPSQNLGSQNPPAVVMRIYLEPKGGVSWHAPLVTLGLPS